MTDSTINHFSEEICSESSASRNIVADWLKTHQAELIDTANYIFANPELAYQEQKSSVRLSTYLQEQGFTVSSGTANIETAFTATWGTGKPILGFLAEYDALPGVGHACGHNLLGTAVIGAACALKNHMETEQIPGTICVYGCPAEEIMSGKIVMNKAGVFDGLDVAVTWHPFDRNRISNDIWMSQDVKNYTFHGVSAHAAKSPQEGRSALDAAELMNIGVNYLREHVPDEVRMKSVCIMHMSITESRQMLFRILQRRIISSVLSSVPAQKMPVHVWINVHAVLP